jgi:hypothetical protein
MGPPYHITVSLGIVTIPSRFNLLKKLLNSIFTGSQLLDEILIVELVSKLFKLLLSMAYYRVT